jgi:choline dehydrogenase
MDYTSEDAAIVTFFALPTFMVLRKAFMILREAGDKTIHTPSPEYDFIIVGGGSAGCALASRLSEDRAITVLLIEAGGTGLEFNARVPAAVGELQHTALDWEDYCEPQPARACTDLIDGKSFWPRGKCLGKQLNFNFLIALRWLVASQYFF